MAKRLLEAGFPAADVAVIGPNDAQGQHGGSIPRKAGSKLRPILIIGAPGRSGGSARGLDAWIPFKFVEKDGYFYGRGTQDMKDSDAIAVADLHPLEEGRLRTGPRHHPRADGGRGGRQVERRRLAARRITAIWSTPSMRSIPTAAVTPSTANRRGGVRGDRKAVRGLPGARHQSRRPQLAARARQRHLPRRRCARGACRGRLSRSS